MADDTSFQNIDLMSSFNYTDSFADVSNWYVPPIAAENGPSQELKEILNAIASLKDTIDDLNQSLCCWIEA
jgi:hypothetical protein